jgi:PPOX class probable F420-dependent enzyme
VTAGRSSVADGVGHLAQLHARDTSFVLTSMAPLPELQAFGARMGWTVPWYSVRARFEGASIAHVATLMPDGAPRSVPMWIGVEGERVVLPSSPNSVKARDLRRDTCVSIPVTDGASPNSMAEVRGGVGEILDADPAWAIIDGMAHGYIGAPYPLRTDRVPFVVVERCD